MLGKFKKWAARYARDEAGQFAMVTALVGLPLVVIGGYAVDINKIVGKKAHISAALDAAALASVVPANLTVVERESFARQVFAENYFGDIPVSLEVDASRELVKITGTSSVPTLFGGIVGSEAVGVSDTASAALTVADVVCVLALDPAGERSIEFLDQSTFFSPACSVQVNSTNELALVSDVVTPPVAKSFCVGGVSRGEFTPFVKHACSAIDDPYANLTPPDDGPCVGIKKITNGTNILSPGTFCDGLSIQGGAVEFLPGVYIVKKATLEFRKGVIVNGDGVTFVLKDGANIEIEKDAQVTLKAQGSGAYAGVVFYQVPDLQEVGKKAVFPTETSIITSGGSLSITGTAYLPSQELIITSDSAVVSQSPATSFIAYRLKFAGKSNTQVHVDHEAGGLPPMQPRSDDGARLIE